MNIVQKDWKWPYPLTPRGSTLYIIIHHTDGPDNQDVGQIWQEHIDEGWDGIGYHYVIKNDGTVVVGRPIYTVGSHALGANHTSVGISLEGDFHPPSKEKPTDAQIASLKELLKTIVIPKYPHAKIIGHRDVSTITGDPGDATACPGDTLYTMLPGIIKGL